jgi:hypothetical protein
MSELTEELPEERPRPQYIVGSYDIWWSYQVKAALPRWIPGTRAANYTDGYVGWPLSREDTIERLTHLASLRAHQ